jgi:hypothetical protein
VLPHGLTDGTAHDDFKDLVLAETGCPGRGDVLVRDRVRSPGDLVDQCPERFFEAGVVECSLAVCAGRACVVRRPRESV